MASYAGEDLPTAALDDEENQGPAKKRQRDSSSSYRNAVAIIRDVPLSTHYHVSWLHRDIVTSVAHAGKHGMVLTGSQDGVVKFWKRKSLSHDDDITTSTSTTAAAVKKTNQATSSHPCLDFVKAFTAHVGAVLCIAVDGAGDRAVSVADGTLKFYDVGAFDATFVIKAPQQQDATFGTSAVWLRPQMTDVVAVTAQHNGSIYVYAPDQGVLLQTLTLHGAHIVTCLVRHPTFPVVLSTDSKGLMELWDAAGTVTTATTAQQTNDDEVPDLGFTVGASLNQTQHGISYASKMDTDWYCLARKNTFCLAAAATADVYCLYGADDKVRVLVHTTGALLVTLDERVQTYDRIHARPPFALDSMEYGKRAAVESEMRHESLVWSAGLPPIVMKTATATQKARQRLLITFDHSGQYLLLPTLVGIKVIDWKRGKLIGIAAKADASQERFVACCLCPGPAQVSQQLQLAQSGGVSSRTSAATAAATATETGIVPDALLIVLAYQQRRFYVISHRDPLAVNADDPDANAALPEVATRRDVWNEAPTAADTLVAGAASRGPASKQAAMVASTATVTAANSKAVLRTTQGDIHLQLFPALTPKTVENFVGHARSGYYDGVIFHRVIKGFMLQTGDPLGDGTGGESIWGGEFSDEIVPTLRHDRPFTLSMANAGPNTNGSQFFITTVPTPWLDKKHTVFGRVHRGVDVVQAMEKVKTDDLDKPLDEIKILSIDID